MRPTGRRPTTVYGIVSQSGGYVWAYSKSGDRRDLFTSDVELLVTDVILPGASGPELYRTLAARKPALKVPFTPAIPSR